MIILTFLIVVIISYLLGSIPFGLLLTKFAGLGDIRDIGSGNIGATNVLRTGNKKLALLTLLFDGLKGSAAILFARYVVGDFVALAGLIALLGHLFPVWLQFKGGKGVATSVGIITALVWPVGVLTMVLWTATAALTRYSSVAALLALGLVPFEVVLWGRSELIWLTLIMAGLVFWRHSANIKRLLTGTEPKIGK